MSDIHPHEFLMVGDNPISDIENAAEDGLRRLLIAPYLSVLDSDVDATTVEFIQTAESRVLETSSR